MLTGKFWQKRKILVSIHTYNTPWQERIREVNKLYLPEVALFLTGLNEKKRKLAYLLLKRSSIKKIPLVHLRNDMGSSEIEYLREKFQTQVFNLHSPRQFPFRYDYSAYVDRIYLENSPQFPLDERELVRFAGVCLDFAHLEENCLTGPPVYQHNLTIIRQFKCGCNHISSFKGGIGNRRLNSFEYASHKLDKLSELNYLKKYPKSYFSQFMALEMENSLEDQLQAREYIIGLLKNKE